MSTSDPVRVLAFRVRNYMNIESAEVRLDSGTYELFGDNSDGKTAFMEAIVAAFAGKRGMVADPIRKGATKAEWFVDAGEFTIERSLSDHGSMKLTVTAANGQTYPHPQAFLDAFLNALAFDPHSFGRMEPAKQAEVLRTILGVDLSPYDQRIRAAEERRLLVGREVASLKGQLDGLAHHADAPAAQVSITKLMNELDRRAKHNAERQAAIDSAIAAIQSARAEGEDWRREQAVARNDIKRLKAELTKAEQREQAAGDELARLERGGHDLQAALSAAEAVEMRDEGEVRRQLKSVQATNNKVMENERRREVADALEAKRRDYDAQTAEIESARREKEQVLAAAEFPVPGLTFDEAGVFYDGIPFAQVSSGQRIRIGVQLFFATRPKLNLILVRDASLLDKANRAVVIEEAAKRNAQVLLEIVGDRPTGDKKRSFTIVDGRVEFDGRTD